MKAFSIGTFFPLPSWYMSSRKTKYLLVNTNVKPISVLVIKTDYLKV